jgi:hypothetical protein
MKVEKHYLKEHSPFGNTSSHLMGHAVTRLLEALRYKAEGSVFGSRWSGYGPGIDSASNRNV